MGFVLMLHSLNRWLVILIAVVTIVRFGMVLLNVRPAGSIDKMLMRVYSADLGIQVILGFIYLVWLVSAAGGALPGQVIGHVVVMLIAVAVAGMANRWAKGDARIFARNGLIAVIASLVLIFIGIAMLASLGLG